MGNADRGSLAKASVAAAVLVMGTSACGQSSPPAPSPATQQAVSIEFSTTWSAGSGIDVGSRSAELVRATFEAGRLAGTFGLPSTPFPGYAEAVSGAAVGENASGLVSPVPITEKTGPWWVVMRIADLTETESAIAATVCELVRHTPDTLDESVERDMRPDADLTTSLHPMAFRVELRRDFDVEDARRGERDDDPASRDRRAVKTPDWNVFQGWRVASLENLSPSGWGDPARADNPEACERWWQEVFPTWTRVPIEFKGTPYASERSTLLAPSGDARTEAQVAVLPPDFPEWIPPSGRDA